ncbi:hypothetical protein [Actinoplanes xinjiangensis]|uniref:hypothetical protein n=1 Tax=Actinoplanes xinjiangensis TaxID=512350 RepID=UPI00341F53ED
MQPPAKPGFDQAIEVVQPLFDSIFESSQTGIEAGCRTVVGSRSPGTVPIHVSRITHSKGIDNRWGASVSRCARRGPKQGRLAVAESA